MDLHADHGFPTIFHNLTLPAGMERRPRRSARSNTPAGGAEHRPRARARPSRPKLAGGVIARLDVWEMAPAAAAAESVSETESVIQQAIRPNSRPEVV